MAFNPRAKAITKAAKRLPTAKAMRKAEAREGPKGNEAKESAAYQRKEARLGIEKHYKPLAKMNYLGYGPEPQTADNPVPGLRAMKNRPGPGGY